MSFLIRDSKNLRTAGSCCEWVFKLSRISSWIRGKSTSLLMMHESALSRPSVSVAGDNKLVVVILNDEGVDKRKEGLQKLFEDDWTVRVGPFSENPGIHIEVDDYRQESSFEVYEIREIERCDLA